MIMNNNSNDLFVNLFAGYDRHKVWFTPKEVGSILGYSDQFVRNAFFSGKFQGINTNGIAKPGEEKKTYIRIHKTSIIEFLLKDSNFDNNSFLDGMRQIFENCSKYRLFAVQKLLNEHIRKT